ncbi:MAG: 4-hydroxythreonine-4-phosphate dehydrogenase PdxA [Ectothiorhodospiraceae bacterium AqS1]|nr:4-hydroxythreonine-4-phosphate dehydrogenase PdxA [Ectothiorhodospiraceae bacterium AqS1]
MKPLIALVQGDAAGIGPEVMSKLLAIDEVRSSARILIVSDARVFRAGNELGAHRIPVNLVEDIEGMEFEGDTPNLLDIPAIDPAATPAGQVSVEAGAAVIRWFGEALDLAAAGKVDGICFMPFNKQAMHRAGLGAEDELQWARQRLGSQARASEFNVIDGMWNARVTSHIPLREVADRLQVQEIAEAVELAKGTLISAGITRPRIAVAALNPHAGEGGAIGDEEIEIIEPAVARAKAQGIEVSGPYPSDTLYPRLRDGQFDCVVSMYHDQGQIAIKLLGFDRGVTVLGGLPVPITTPAHGTAYDIARKNVAAVEPARRAFMTLCRMAMRDDS